MFGWDSCVTERIVARLDLQTGDFYFMNSLQTGSGVYLAFSPFGCRGLFPGLKRTVGRLQGVRGNMETFVRDSCVSEGMQSSEVRF
jgi:hypothetical protein